MPLCLHRILYSKFTILIFLSSANFNFFNFILVLIVSWLAFSQPCGQHLSTINTRVHIDYAISRYRSRIGQHCNIVSPRDRPISCMNTHLNTRMLLTGTGWTHEQCRPATFGYLGPSLERPLYTASRLQGTAATAHVKPPTTMSRRQQWQGRASWVARPAPHCHSHARGPRCVQSTEVCGS